MPRLIRFAFILGWMVTIGWAASANITVYSETYRDYRHPKDESGNPRAVPYRIHFKKEVFGTRGEATRTPEFATALAKAIAQELELRQFEFSHDPEKAEQLIIVHAGTTENRGVTWMDMPGPGGGMISVRQDSLGGPWGSINNSVLGYGKAMGRANTLSHTITGRTQRQDLNDDLGSPRNYLIVSGYDFGIFQEKSQPLLLWRTYVNVESGDVPFADQVDTLLATAGRYLGRDSSRLIRRFNSEVQIGDAVVVEEDVESKE